MTGIHRERPGAGAIAPARGDPAVDLGDRIWLSPGLSNAYLLGTEDGRVLGNAGMGFEGPLHRRLLAVRSLLNLSGSGVLPTRSMRNAGQTYWRRC